MESNFHIDPSSVWNGDPFAPPINRASMDGKVKPASIKEILETLNGYRMPCNDPSALNNRNSHEAKVDKLMPSKISRQENEPDDLLIITEYTDSKSKNFRQTYPSNPIPLRGAFNCDPDCYDFHSIDERCERNLQTINDLTGEFPSTSTLASQSASQDSIGSSVFKAAPNDVIVVDGNDGYESIDLSCFNLDQASFQGDRILVQVDHHYQFEIEYANVKWAVFAEGETIQLSGGASSNGLSEVN